MGEFYNSARKFRESLRNYSNDALYVHQNNRIPDETDSNDFRESLMTSVMKMMELEGEVHKYETLFDNMGALIEEYGDLIPTDEELTKKWEDEEEKIGTVKGPNRKNFKDIIKTIRDEKPERDEDEMEVMQVQHSKVDPISKKDIVNPVINEKCGHVYDRESITEFAGKKKTIKCAMQGCSETILISKLVDYPEYWNNVKP